MREQRRSSASENYFWPIVWAVGLHILIFGTLFVSFAITSAWPSSKPIVQVTLYQLKSKNQATAQTNHKIAGDAKKSTAHQTEVEQMAQKKDKFAEKAADAKKTDETKASEAKKVDAAKRAHNAKKADDAKKTTEIKKAEEKKLTDIAKKKAVEAARKSTEEKKAQALADLLSDTPYRQQTLADKQGYEVASGFDDLIRARAAAGWTRPPSARKNMTVVLQIGMLPDGTVTSVVVARSSGDRPFDNSAAAAVENIGRLAEMQGMEPSDFNPYRSFKMTFTPEDLAL